MGAACSFTETPKPKARFNIVNRLLRRVALLRKCCYTIKIWIVEKELRQTHLEFRRLAKTSIVENVEFARFCPRQDTVSKVTNHVRTERTTLLGRCDLGTSQHIPSMHRPQRPMLSNKRHVVQDTPTPPDSASRFWESQGRGLRHRPDPQWDLPVQYC